MKDNGTITAVIQSSEPVITGNLRSGGEISVRFDASIGNLQKKSIAPSSKRQVIYPDRGYSGMNVVVVEPIPSNYGEITYDGSKIIIS
ncbi:hypothetical protein [uncultured Dialister sp.]|uniref:hypothetical protein n=1 Tax=uncultured Dialister sp. TaxID=278064 RepID=UPI0026DAC509|nr:hypothetical protein [uncultured Dialister sp.]